MKVNDKTIFKSKYIEVKERNNWYELSSSTGSNELVAVILRNGKGECLVRYENCPPYYQNGKEHMSMVALTGMKEVDETPIKAIIREIKEETGIDRKYYMLKYRGWVFTNKQSDLKIHLFYARERLDIGKNKKFIGEGDGTRGEKGSYAKFVSRRQAIRSRCGILKMLLSLNALD